MLIQHKYELGPMFVSNITVFQQDTQFEWRNPCVMFNLDRPVTINPDSVTLDPDVVGVEEDALVAMW